MADSFVIMPGSPQLKTAYWKYLLASFYVNAINDNR